MFDVGFLELAVIMILALLVLGPERLPKVARSVGYWFGKARRYVEGMKEQVEAEFDTTEVKRLLHNQDVQLRELKDKLSDAESTVSSEIKNQFEDDFDDDDPGNGHQDVSEEGAVEDQSESERSAAESQSELQPELQPERQSEPQYEIIEEDDTPKSYLDSNQSPLLKKQAARAEAKAEKQAMDKAQ